MNDRQEQPASGVDLARVALRSAREAARRSGRTTEAPARRPRGRSGPGRGAEGREPRGLAAVLLGLVADRAWEAPAAGGSIVDHWPTVAGPRLAAHVRAVTFRSAEGVLEVQVDSPAWFTQLRLSKPQLLARFREMCGPGMVKDIARTRSAPAQAAAAGEPSISATTSAEDPQAAPSPGYRAALASHQAVTRTRSRPGQAPSRRSWAREPERGSDHGTADQPVRDLAAVTRARALARARHERAQRAADDRLDPPSSPAPPTPEGGGRPPSPST
ncbi:DciA family protein [Streptomyces sp. NPDC053474]|uniref:DciA family protein n=1 Tax=Streptomyces sp. NPDC053474 TaxID=3365704 RepID=UPI0037D97661